MITLNHLHILTRIGIIRCFFEYWSYETCPQQGKQAWSAAETGTYKLERVYPMCEDQGADQSAWKCSWSAGLCLYFSYMLTAGFPMIRLIFYYQCLLFFLPQFFQSKCYIIFFSISIPELRKFLSNKSKAY